ncbi:MAG: ADP-ribosylglycohydrolase family protein [bacterium]
MITVGLCLLLMLSAPRVFAQSKQTLSEARLLDKIKGGWAGQMIGVSVGGPTEFRAQSKIYDKPIEWNPASVRSAIGQDDLYVDMTFAKVMDDEGLDAPMVSYGKAFANSKYELWHANFIGRQNCRNGILPPESGHPLYNGHADDIDFQIEADFIGLMCPGMPATSNEFCDRVGHVMNYGDGVYGGMFVCALYAVAYFEADIPKIVEAGIQALPPESEYARCLRDVMAWYKQYPDDWKKTWQMFEDKWANTDICPQGTYNAFDIDAKTNGAYIAIGLLYGKGDFQKTVNIATQCGQDSDCNPASAAGVLGLIMGYEKLPKDWTQEIEVIKNEKFSFTDYSFEDICRSTLERAKKLIVRHGGSIENGQITVALQEPVPAKLEQWKQDQPAAVVNDGDPAFTWKGAWKQDDEERVSNEAGAEAVFTFEGTGAMVLGSYNPNAGLANIYLDGEKKRSINMYYHRGKGSESLFHVMGLPRGKHTITIEVAGRKDPNSGDYAVFIDKAIVFDGPEKPKP